MQEQEMQQFSHLSQLEQQQEQFQELYHEKQEPLVQYGQQNQILAQQLQELQQHLQQPSLQQGAKSVLQVQFQSPPLPTSQTQALDVLPPTLQVQFQSPAIPMHQTETANVSPPVFQVQFQSPMQATPQIGTQDILPPVLQVQFQSPPLSMLQAQSLEEQCAEMQAQFRITSTQAQQPIVEPQSALQMSFHSQTQAMSLGELEEKLQSVSQCQLQRPIQAIPPLQLHEEPPSVLQVHFQSPMHMVPQSPSLEKPEQSMIQVPFEGASQPVLQPMSTEEPPSVLQVQFQSPLQVSCPVQAQGMVQPQSVLPSLLQHQFQFQGPFQRMSEETQPIQQLQMQGAFQSIPQKQLPPTSMSMQNIQQLQATPYSNAQLLPPSSTFATTHIQFQNAVQSNQDVRFQESRFRFPKPPLKFQEPQFRDSLLRLGFQEPSFGFQEPLFRLHDPRRFKETQYQFQESPLRFQDPILRFQDPQSRFQERPLRFQARPVGFQEPPQRINESVDQFQRPSLQLMEPLQRFQHGQQLLQHQEQQQQETLLQFQESPHRKSQPHTVITLQRSQGDLGQLQQDSVLQPRTSYPRPEYPSSLQTRWHRPYKDPQDLNSAQEQFSNIRMLSRMPLHMQQRMALEMQMPPGTIESRQFPHRNIPGMPPQMLTPALDKMSQQVYAQDTISQPSPLLMPCRNEVRQTSSQNIFHGLQQQGDEPVMQQIPLLVTGHEPRNLQAPMDALLPRPIRIGRPRTPAVPDALGPTSQTNVAERHDAGEPQTEAQKKNAAQDGPQGEDTTQTDDVALREAKSKLLEFQTKLQQHILEQHKQMQDQLKSTQSRHGTSSSPTSSIKIQMHHRSAPQLPDAGRQGLEQQMRMKQQMYEQQIQRSPQMMGTWYQPQLEEQFRNQRMLGGMQQRDVMKDHHARRHLEVHSSSDSGGYMHRLTVTSTPTKSSLADTESPTEYGNESTYTGTKSLVPEHKIEKRKLPPTPTRKYNYRHAAIETRMRNSQTEMVVYFVVLLATIIGLWTVLDIYGRRVSGHPNGTVFATAGNGSIKGISSKEARAGILVNVSGPPGFEICSSAACQAEGSYISHELNWNVNPCESMYEFVCSNRVQAAKQSTDEAVLSDLERALLRVLQNPASTMRNSGALQHLWRECLDSPARNRLGWGPLKHMLKAVALGDWPYLQFSTQGEAAVWEAAARVLRYFGLATLVQLEPSDHPVPGSTPTLLLALDKPTLLPRPTNDTSWYYDMVSLAASAAARKNVALHSVAMEVTNFARQLAGVVRSQSVVMDLSRENKIEKLRSVPRYQALLEGFLQNDSHVSDDTEVLLRAPEYVIRLGYLLDDTPPHIVLNYIGFRLLVHVSPFLPEALRKLTLARARQLGLGPRASSQLICLRVTQQALPTLFYRTAYEAHHELLDALLAADLGIALKQALASRLTLLHWLDGATRERALQQLHHVQLRLLFPAWVTDSLKAAQDARQVPRVIPGEGLRSYARITKQLMQRRLGGAEPWLAGVPTDQECWLEPNGRVLHVPLAALNASSPAQEPFLLLQLARLGERASRCLVRLLLEGAGESRRNDDPRFWWTPAARQGFSVVRKCYALQSRAELPDLRAAEDNAALVVAHSAFEARMPALDFRLENAISMSLDQLFFIHYTLSHCSSDPQTTRRVNLALLNFGGFQRAFTCDPGTPMNPRKSCDFW